ncbi:SPOR domain-containing protein [Acidovorax sp. LjRoot38]|uniref:SPOR domain-containing protein n=1 Tax=Acidovorax sp. LjRoot38 TaxID=3342327 RepID=UPI003ECC23D6
MLDHTDPVASIIPAMSLDSPSDNAMTALSRLALGPVNTTYYMAVFERFDNTGRTTTTWNWAACLATLNWMLFRQLWTPALVYLAAAEGLALIVYGIGRTFLQWPPGVELGVLGAFAMLAFAVPGLYGNAILYADIRKRVARALAASRTLPEACVLLEKQASSRKRLQALVLANLVLVAAVALAYLVWAPSDTKPLALEPAVTVAQATAAAASRPSAAASAPAAAIAAAPSPAPAPVPVPVPAQEPPTPALPATTASAPDPAKPAAAPATPAPKAAATASTPARSSEANRPAPATLSAASTVSKTPSSAPATAAPKPSAKTTPPAEPASRAASAAKAKTPKASASAAAPASSAPLPTVGTAAGYYINVGLFADEANARKAQARLLNEGLPAFRQELNNAKGRRIRVRVGPYESRAKAEAAAASIRAMALEAVVFKQ